MQFTKENVNWLQALVENAGKTAGLGLLLRASPHHGARRRSYIPLETAAKVCSTEHLLKNKWIVELNQVAFVFSEVVVFKTVSLSSQSRDGEGFRGWTLINWIYCSCSFSSFASIPKFQDIIAFLDLMEMPCNLSLFTVWPCSGGDVSWSKHGRSSKCCSWGCSLVMQSLSVIAEMFTITYPKILNCIISQFFKIKFIFRQQFLDVLFKYLGMFYPHLWNCLPFSIASWRSLMILIPDNNEISCTWMQESLNICIELNFKIHFFDYCERFLIICKSNPCCSLSHVLLLLKIRVNIVCVLDIVRWHLLQIRTWRRPAH